MLLTKKNELFKMKNQRATLEEEEEKEIVVVEYKENKVL